MKDAFSAQRFSGEKEWVASQKRNLEDGPLMPLLINRVSPDTQREFWEQLGTVLHSSYSQTWLDASWLESVCRKWNAWEAPVFLSASARSPVIDAFLWQGISLPLRRSLGQPRAGSQAAILNPAVREVLQNLFHTLLATPVIINERYLPPTVRADPTSTPSLRWLLGAEYKTPLEQAVKTKVLSVSTVFSYQPHPEETERDDDAALQFLKGQPEQVQEWLALHHSSMVGLPLEWVWNLLKASPRKQHDESSTG